MVSVDQAYMVGHMKNADGSINNKNVVLSAACEAAELFQCMMSVNQKLEDWQRFNHTLELHLRSVECEKIHDICQAVYGMKHPSDELEGLYLAREDEQMGFEHVVSCLCECEVKARQELDEKMQREEAQRQLYQRKSVGLRERRFWEWKFENDNGSNQKILIARQYVENWTDMKRKNVGLLLMGPVGTGKSFFAGCIANALLEQGERVMMTNFSRILNEMTSYQANKNQIIQNLVDYPLLIIDDLGIERNSEFALEQVYNVIDSRYCKMLPLIVTTNLGLNEMKSADLDTAHQRIYSRILELCVPIYCGGEDKRKEEGTEKLVQVQNLITG